MSRPEDQSRPSIFKRNPEPTEIKPGDAPKRRMSVHERQARELARATVGKDPQALIRAMRASTNTLFRDCDPWEARHRELFQAVAAGKNTAVDAARGILDI